MASKPGYRWQNIEERLLRGIYDSDQAIYPAPQLTYDRLKSWVDACPALCLCLHRDESESTSQLDSSGSDDAIIGLIIVLPLRQSYWDKLRHANIEEHDVDAKEMFAPPLNTEIPIYGAGSRINVGLHVFHIERFTSSAPTWKNASFTALALEEIRGRVAATFQAWEVVGYSALTATKHGTVAFKRLGFTPSDSASGNSLLHKDAEMVERRSNGSFFDWPSRAVEIMAERKAEASPGGKKEDPTTTWTS